METGYYKQVLKTRHVEASEGIEEQGHYETVTEYSNGGKDVRWVVDVPGLEPIEEHDEDYLEDVWVDYTPAELAEQEIDELKKFLANTDYIVVKLYEAVVMKEDTTELEEEYHNTIILRKKARNRINELEDFINQINNLESGEEVE